MKQFSRAILVCSLVLASTVSAEKTHVFRPSMDFGIGIDGVTGEIRGACVNISAAAASEGGQQALLRISKVESSREMRELLGLEVEASYAGIGGGKLDYLESQEFNRFNQYVVATVRVENSQRIPQLSDVTLTDSARQLLENGQIDRFDERCGTEFLFAQTTGGQFFALYEFTTESQTQSEELEAELEGGYGGFSASGQFQSALEQVSRSSSMKINIFREGDDTQVPSDPEGIIDYAVNFPIAISNIGKARAYSMVSLPYTVLDLPSIDTAHFDSSTFNNELKLITLRRDIYGDAIADLKFVVERPEQFDEFDREEMLRHMETYRKGQRALEKRARHCLERERDACFTPQSDEVVTLVAEEILPTRQRIAVIDPLVAHKIACDKASTQSALILQLEEANRQISMLVRTATDDFRPRFVGSTSPRTKKMVWSRWPTAGKYEKVDVQPGCKLYRDLEVRQGRVCFAVVKRVTGRMSFSESMPASQGDVSCIESS